MEYRPMYETTGRRLILLHNSNNAMTLDICDYWFDGELIEENGYVLSVMQKALALERPVKVRMRFKVLAEYLPKKINFVCETPELFKMSCNGKELSVKDEGYIYDRSFRLIDLEDRSAGTFGYLVYFFELACAVSGYVLDVNPFDQPGVEAYKKNMFALLGKPGYEDRRAALEARM